MNPWELLAWLLVGIVGLVVLAILAAIVLLCISVSLYLRDKKIETLEKEREFLESQMVGPHFRTMEVGSTFNVSYALWRIENIETEEELHGGKRLRITAVQDWEERVNAKRS